MTILQATTANGDGQDGDRAVAGSLNSVQRSAKRFADYRAWVQRTGRWSVSYDDWKSDGPAMQGARAG